MDFNELARNYGPFVAVLVVMGPSMYKALTWTAENVVKPLTVRHIQFLDEMTASHKVTKTTLDKLAETQVAQVANEVVLTDLAKTKIAMLVKNEGNVLKIIETQVRTNLDIQKVAERVKVILDIEAKEEKDKSAS